MKNNDPHALKKIIFSRVLLIPFIILLLVCGTLVYYFADYAGAHVKSSLMLIADEQRLLIDQFFKEKISKLQFIASSFHLDELNSEAELTAIFHNLQSGSKAFFDLGVFDENGNHLAYVGPYNLTGKNYSQAPWFKAVQKKGIFISDEFLGYRDIPHFIIAVRRNEGETTWYLRATIDTLFFRDLVECIRIDTSGEAYLINKMGVFQTGRRSGGKIMEPDPEFNTYLLDKEKITSFSAKGGAGRRHLYAAGPLKQNGWFIVVRQQMRDAYAPLATAVFISIIMIICGSLVVIVIGYFLASGVANTLILTRMEKQEMKTQLIIAGKLAEVGEMTTGIAHEINNPLQVMKSELTMIEDVLSCVGKSLKTSNPENFRLLYDSVKQVGIQINRCGNITKGLLKFARKTGSTRQPVELQRFLPEVVNMVEEKARVENIRIVQEFDSDLPAIISDPNQLQQVFLNLFNNAIYALTGNTSGEIRIRAFKEDGGIEITITDNGCGFDPGDMEKAFMPFFTTKPVGEGTGLGLSTVYGIIKGFGGEITLTSEPDSGSLFTIHLPLKAESETL